MVDCFHCLHGSQQISSQESQGTSRLCVFPFGCPLAGDDTTCLRILVSNVINPIINHPQYHHFFAINHPQLKVFGIGFTTLIHIACFGTCWQLIISERGTSSSSCQLCSINWVPFRSWGPCLSIPMRPQIVPKTVGWASHSSHLSRGNSHGFQQRSDVRCNGPRATSEAEASAASAASASLGASWGELAGTSSNSLKDETIKLKIQWQIKVLLVRCMKYAAIKAHQINEFLRTWGMVYGSSFTICWTCLLLWVYLKT